MSRITITEFGGDAVGRAEKLLAGIPGGTEKAVKSALGRAVSTLRTRSAKTIRERYAIAAGHLRMNENITVKYTYSQGATAYVTFSGRKIPLYRYNGAAPRSPAQDTSRWVKAIVNGEWKTVHPGAVAAGHQFVSTAPKTFYHAFVARMASGHTGIFERDGGTARTGGDSISEIMGSSVPQMLGNKSVEERLSKHVEETFQKRLEHEIGRILLGYGG